MRSLTEGTMLLSMPEVMGSQNYRAKSSLFQLQIVIAVLCAGFLRFELEKLDEVTVSELKGEDKNYSFF